MRLTCVWHIKRIDRWNIINQFDSMDEKEYLVKIKNLESEIEYLHGLLDEAGISYKRKATLIQNGWVK